MTWLNQAQAAEYLGARVRQIRRWSSEGKLTYTKFGAKRLYLPEYLDVFVRDHTVMAKPSE